MTIDERQVADYLTQRLGARVTVTALKRTFPGFSRETWLVNTEIAGEPHGFVVRLDPPEGGGSPASMKLEYDIYCRLYGSEVPVAEPLWYDEGIDFAAGRAHMVRRLVDGSPTVAGLFDSDSASAKRRRNVAFECVEKLATVHRLDWKARGLGELLPAPPSAAQCFAAEHAIWTRYWYERRPAPAPVFEEALLWLRENIPTDTPRISLVKGNNGLGEEIWRNEKIIAMSDWELACLSDGVADLFWSQGTVRLVGFKDVLRHYEQCMGQSISLDRIAYASLFALVKQYIGLRAFWYLPYHHGRTGKLQALSTMPFSVEAETRLGRCIGKSLDEAYAIINGKEKSMYVELDGSNR